jgi:tetratricopeptide (TPR) repeat protein
MGKEALDSHPESPMLFWYLARVLREEGRDGDSAAYFERAARAADAALASHPESAGDLLRLKEMASDDQNSPKGLRPSFPLSPRIFFQAEKLYAGKHPRLPSPQAIRLELGRPGEFKERIDWAIDLSKKERPGTGEHLRYWSLKLKYLEEMERREKLYEELERMQKDAEFEDPGALALFQSSAKRYEARVRLSEGDREGSLAAYDSALGLLANTEAPAQKDAIRLEMEAVRSGAAAAR